MTNRRLPSAAVVVLASVIAAAGMGAHNMLEFGPAFLLKPETVVPLMIFGLFAFLASARPGNAVVYVLLLAWAVLNLVGGGILSVLPLGLFPFQPEQSLGHYGAHVIYAVAQLPLVVVAARALSRRGRRGAAEDAR
jgi:hypothetical protein